MAKQQSMVEKVRAAMAGKIAEKPQSAGNPKEFSPDFGSYRIRILPPVGEDFSKNPKSISESDMFYNTVKFHFMPSLSVEEVSAGKFSSAGKFLWVSKYLTDKNGNSKRDPISESVQQWYSIGRKEQDQSLLNLGGALKLKRHYFANIILYHDDGSFEHKILVDRTNEGKLMKVICAAMGLPFIRDIEDNWVSNEDNYFDPDQEYYDLLDPSTGFDFKIVKEKTGPHNWDISFEKSFVMKKAQRALSAEELELLAERVDLKKVVDVETSYEVVEATLNLFLGDEVPSADEEEKVEDKPIVSEKKSLPSKPAKVTKAKIEDDDDSEIDDLLGELDD